MKKYKKNQFVQKTYISQKIFRALEINIPSPSQRMMMEVIISMIAQNHKIHLDTYLSTEEQLLLYWDAQGKAVTESTRL